LSKLPQLRADAARNRERLIAVARDRFTRGEETTPLEAIAQEAGVGIGTFYRHFPTREALVEAVYRSELDALDTHAEELLANHKAWNALRLWMDRYATFVAAKRGMQDALRIAWTSRSSPVPETRARATATIRKFVTAGISDGTIRADIEPDDVTVGLVGVFLATATSMDQDQVRRLLDLLADGLSSRR
jgi:AcrR family transcriptional regulator